MMQEKQKKSFVSEGIFEYLRGKHVQRETNMFKERQTIFMGQTIELFLWVKRTNRQTNIKSERRTQKNYIEHL